MGFFYILAVVVGIGFLIFAHELGHFLLAKLNGVRVDLFSLGFGPVLLSYRKGMGVQAGAASRRVEAMQKRLRELKMAAPEGAPEGEEERRIRTTLKSLGQTEYRLSAIPLGGFVKMAGEPLSEERTGAPDELTSKKPGQRFLIFVAGTAMNFLVAFPICMLAFAVGRSLSEPRLSSVPAPDSAEWAAGMTVGDRILSVNGVPVASIESYKKEVLRAETGRPIPVEVERGDPAQRVTLQLVPRGADRISVMPPTNVVDLVHPGSPAERAGLRPGDVILAIDGREVLGSQDIFAAVKSAANRALAFRVRRPATGETLDLSVTPELNPNTEARLALDPLDLARVPVIRKIHPLSCAADFLKEGDQILAIDDKPMASDRDVRETVRARPGQVVTLKILRAGEEKVSHFTLRRNALGQGTLDVLIGGTGNVAILGEIPPGSPLAQAGASAGDRIRSFEGWEGLSAEEIEQNIREGFSKSVRLSIARAAGGDPIEVDLPVEKGPDGVRRVAATFAEAYPILLEVPASWPLHAAGLRDGDRVLRVDVDGDGSLDRCTSLEDLQRAAESGRPFAVEIERNGKPLPFTVTPGPIPYGEIRIGLRIQTVFHRFPKRQAVILGAREVLDIAHLTFQILGKILQGQEKASNMSGPIGIFSVSYKVIQDGIGNFFWLLALISVSLAIFNLFPIPILDGGHILFLLIEKIKGSPVSEKMMIRAQYVGLFLILALFLYVTKNDLMLHVFGRFG